MCQYIIINKIIIHLTKGVVTIQVIINIPIIK